ncbi:Gfo/Idh/MocA family oxidoreductase [Sulfitobacter sp. G21635-S1]|uniref:Gfo/Idh/MocA family protein n=1 Tax=Sulfitobacter sp. G21635-S1 TaxID=3014043 RepID=UPI0022AFA16B|nr:Gfo/Idh/MocA family oxidoreductase [Sulfitobacter sp. G21635-S1]MCZ4255520.1 Gfo/Idh/MocA family oxidoreductase [Sulfitobacter sp. G21635-S1]
MTATNLALVGIGKIARDQHIPALAASDAFQLAATVSRSGGTEGVENYDTVEALLAARPDIPAISFCTPPQVRYAGARTALAAGRHVMLEKPPGASLSEIRALETLAQDNGLTLFATWHSRHAASVPAAKAWLSDKTVKSVRIDWKEDVRVWHPGQQWIWEAGGLGIFDPAINAFSILTEILPVEVHVTGAELQFPSNCETPIAGKIRMDGPHGPLVTADIDFLWEGDALWRLIVETDDRTLTLDQGGAVLEIDGIAQHAGAREETNIHGEYDGLYARFADLLDTNTSEVDLRPMVLVADAYTLGKRIEAPEFIDPTRTAN